MLWKELRGYAGINIQKIVNMAEEVSTATPEDREEKIGQISIFVDKWLQSYRVYKVGLHLYSFRLFRKYFVCIFFVIREVNR